MPSAKLSTKKVATLKELIHFVFHKLYNFSGVCCCCTMLNTVVLTLTCFSIQRPSPAHVIISSSNLYTVTLCYVSRAFSMFYVAGRRKFNDVRTVGVTNASTTTAYVNNRSGEERYLITPH